MKSEKNIDDIPDDELPENILEYKLTSDYKKVDIMSMSLKDLYRYLSEEIERFGPDNGFDLTNDYYDGPNLYIEIKRTESELERRQRINRYKTNMLIEKKRL